MDDLRFFGDGDCLDLVCDPDGSTSRDLDALARLVEVEILPRLMLAHRRPASRRPAFDLADPDALVGYLLTPADFDLDAAVDSLLRQGPSLDRLLLDLLAPAARRLGTLWEEDTCDFLAVTEGLGRLQALARSLCAGMEREAGPLGRSILLMPCPGETHVFGVSILASFFREAGWEVTTLGPSTADPAEVLRTGWYDVLGLSLSCDVFAPELKSIVPALRRASRNSSVFVLVGGPYFARTGVEAAAFGADACALDAWTAPDIAGAMLDRPALAC